MGTIDQEVAATSNVMKKISQAMELLGTTHVGNIIMREGRRLEYETSVQGKVSIVDFDTPDMEVGSPLTREEMEALFQIVSPTWREHIKQGGLDGPVRFEGMGRYRAHIFLWGGEHQGISDGFKGMMAAFIRVIPDKIPALNTLGLPPYMTVLGDANYGLLLVTGPTGAGKTTTVASFVNHINIHRVGHIITIEDPIEFDIAEVSCRVTPREVGTNVRDLETGVRDAMREIPLAIMVGEVRDAATLNQTMRAARSGHYVCTTKHAPNAVSAVRALIDELPGESSANAAMVAETLLGVIYQVRIPSIESGQWVVAYECLNVTNSPAAQKAIADQDWTALRSLIDNPADPKSQPLNQALFKLIKDQKIIPDSADRRAYDRGGLRELIQKDSALARERAKQ